MNQKSKFIFFSKYLYFFIFSMLLSCTKTPDKGPLEVKYERDKCSECGMVISDSRFTAEIRGGKDHSYHAHKFDDIGCAMKFARKQSWIKDTETEFFVRNYDKDMWLDAKKAAYKKVKNSPMGYGFSAHETKDDKSIDYESVDKKIGE